MIILMTKSTTENTELEFIDYSSEVPTPMPSVAPTHNIPMAPSTVTISYLQTLQKRK